MREFVEIWVSLVSVALFFHGWFLVKRNGPEIERSRLSGEGVRIYADAIFSIGLILSLMASLLVFGQRLLPELPEEEFFSRGFFYLFYLQHIVTFLFSMSLVFLALKDS